MQDKNGEHPWGDAGQIISAGLFFILWTADSFIFHRTTFLANAVPLTLRLTALCLFLMPVIYLVHSGHRVIPRPERPVHLVTDGAFKYVRHPLYLASLLTYLGLAISTLSVIAMGLWVGIFIFHNYIAAYEENFIEQKTGHPYREYSQKTGRWIPRPAVLRLLTGNH